VRPPCLRAAGGWAELTARLCSSNGIQLGGVRSASGVIGTWTGASHDEGALPRVLIISAEAHCPAEDPAGPFWMWKVPDDAPKLFMENN
jgi:hypothetical protein